MSQVCQPRSFQLSTRYISVNYILTTQKNIIPMHMLIRNFI